MALGLKRHDSTSGRAPGRRPSGLKTRRGPVARDLTLNSRPAKRCGKVFGRRVRRSSGAPNRTSSFLALWKRPSFMPGATSKRCRARSARKRRRAISMDCRSNSPVLTKGSRSEIATPAVRGCGPCTRTRSPGGTAWRARSCQESSFAINGLAAERSRTRKGNRELWIAPV